MNSDNSEEIFPVVDAAGNVVGKATRGECHGGSMLLHPVVHLHVFNSRGELYLQKRPAWKDIQPGRWDTAVGGHVDYGETIAEALRREVREELGITDLRRGGPPERRTRRRAFLVPGRNPRKPRTGCFHTQLRRRSRIDSRVIPLSAPASFPVFRPPLRLRPES